MPITNELGHEVRNRLPDLQGSDDITEAGFEAWLSVRVAAMPFLEGHENARRLADAQLAISVIAAIIDERTTLAVADPLPLWLEQLISIWHAERALVVTFNYDNIVERVINQVRPVAFEGNDMHAIRSDDVVYPAPPPPPAVTFDDFDAGSSDSFQLLKMHGSVNWFWNAGDTTGSSLAKHRERSRYDGQVDRVTRDYSAIGHLDRFLIPPVETKHDYYTPPLTHLLWRSAGESIRRASHLTLMGYSMPSADRATVELLRTVPRTARIHVVDRTPGAVDQVGSLVERLSHLVNTSPTAHSGQAALAEYVAARLAELQASLLGAIKSVANQQRVVSVVIAMPTSSRGSSREVVFALALKDGEYRLVEITDEGVRKVSGGSAMEAAQNSQARGSYAISDFVDASRLDELITREGIGSIVVQHGSRRWVPFSAEHFTLNRSLVLRIHLVPTE